MGANSHVVRCKDNPEFFFFSCSDGAGRIMSCTAAKKGISVKDQERAAVGKGCRKYADVIDEIPMAYRDTDAVMAAQTGFVEVAHTLK